MKLSKREIITIKIHKFCARLLYLLDHIWRLIIICLFLFSKKARAKKLMRIGEVFEFQKETETAVQYYEKVLKRCPSLKEINLNLCRCYLRLLLLDKAKSHGMEYLKHKPEDPEGNLYMGVIMYYEKKWNDALTHLAKAVKLFPERERKIASAQEYMAECYLKLNEYERAVELFEKVIKVNPYGGGDRKFVSLGEAYYFLGKREEALNVFKKAVSINPDNHETWNNIGVLLWSDGQVEKACQCFRKALTIKPDYEEAMTNLVAIEEMLKDRGSKLFKVVQNGSR